MERKEKTTPETAPASPQATATGKSRRSPGAKITLIQILACALILAAALVLHFMGGPVYQTVRDWYYEISQQSLVAEEEWEKAAETVGAQLISRITGE